MQYIERESGEVVGLSRWPRTKDQERLPENHPDVVGYRVGSVKLSALAEVKDLAQAKVADLDSSITKATAKAAVLPFKTQFQDATTEGEVETVKQQAMATIDAL